MFSSNNKYLQRWGWRKIVEFIEATSQILLWWYHDHIILGDHHLDISWPCQDLLNEASSDSDLAGLYQGQLFSRGFHGDTTRFDEVIVILERWIWPTGRFDHNGDAEKTQRCFDLKREMFIKPTNINKHQQTWICKTKTQDISGWLKLIPPQHVPRSYASTPGLLANAKLHNFTFLQHHRLALQLAHAELGALSRELLKRDLTHTERSCSPHPHWPIWRESTFPHKKKLRSPNFIFLSPRVGWENLQNSPRFGDKHRSDVTLNILELGWIQWDPISSHEARRRPCSAGLPRLPLDGPASWNTSCPIRSWSTATAHATSIQLGSHWKATAAFVIHSHSISHIYHHYNL